ncbi:hypothetical protein [Microbulbifer hainanensis]|uniref:hypothetical protein n=1 Tax=Microbulbifer hainanensis TaxID=2735675 RepID=UPI0018694106|nr:hypothetical protein [Microbulbifer hainanensis]
MNPILSRLFPSALLLVSGICHANPAFFIDTPELLRKAQEFVHATYPDIQKSELVASGDTFHFSCTPERKRYRQEEAARQCLKHPFSSTPCSVEVNLMLRSTVEQTITAQRNGLCLFSTHYRPVIVEFFQDGAIEARRPEFQFQSGETGDCNEDHTPREIIDLANTHEAILAKEYSTSTSKMSSEVIANPDGYFMVDYKALFQNAQNAILEKFPQASTENLHLTDSHFSFICDDQVRWKQVNPRTLQIPSQKESIDLCHTSFTFVSGSSRIEQFQDADSGSIKCRSIVPNHGYHVNVFSDGKAEAHRTGVGYYREASCDSISDIPSVDEAITQYRQLSVSQ